MDYYIWYDASTNRVVHAGDAETASKFYPDAVGDYYLLGDLWGYCLEQSEVFNYEGIISSTNETARGGLEWKIFPNPSKDFINLQFNAPMIEDYWEIRVYDGLQREVLFKQVGHLSTGMEFQFDARSLPAGVYSIHIKGASQLQSGRESIVIVK